MSNKALKLTHIIPEEIRDRAARAEYSIRRLAREIWYDESTIRRYLKRGEMPERTAEEIDNVLRPKSQHVLSAKIVWHDLTEDPNDVPCHSDLCWVLCMDMYFHYNDDHTAQYRPNGNYWEWCDTDGDFSYGIYKSYGTPSRMPVDIIYNSEFVVVAWAEIEWPDLFIPKKFQTKEEERK